MKFLSPLLAKLFHPYWQRGKSTPLFLLGAGFNADAAGEAGSLYGNSIYVSRYVLDCSYPLVAATARLCFGLDEPPADRSIEELFRDALERRDYGPLEDCRIGSWKPITA